MQSSYHSSVSAGLILLDNNALQHSLNKHTSPKFSDILGEYKSVGATLGISNIVIYEALKAIAFDQNKAAAVTTFINEYLTRYPVDESVLTQATRVHEIYGSNIDVRQRRSGFSTEDIIIGTTAMMLGAFILTSDCNDFPMPFFEEVSREIIYYEDKGKRKYVVIYLLRPDNEIIGNALDALTTNAH